MKGWKTITFNVVTLIVTVLESAEVMDVIPADWHPWVLAGVAVANIGLRMVTTTPVGRG